MFINATLIAKLVLGIVFLIVHINLFGKSNLAPTSPMDQIQNYVLGAIVGGVIYNADITVLDFFFVLVTWALLCMVIKVLKEHNGFFKKIIDGSTVSLVTNGKIDVSSCMKYGVSANDLMLKLRSQGVYEISKIRKAYFEQSGQLTVISYGDDMLRLPLIVDGHVDEDALEATGHDQEWLDAQLKKQGYSQISSVYLAENDSGKLKITGYNN
ncbi:DUF421 domain-containing protein [Bifidobacterium bombi]|uniref:Membrane protein yetF n=1 Tax=Bifidobacterium bombi DSM 19703 TaxID=1341695 RepID=A0A086BNU4_9BIFI|nr:DUF421 domain-containing protein [Bifidobacterium bombi]KFF30608.1 hypothetical protein BBOMB_1471 [Bifidobacterium bombi DSM 19703]